MDDRALVEALRSGEPQAPAWLLLQFHGALHLMAFMRAGDFDGQGLAIRRKFVSSGKSVRAAGGLARNGQGAPFRGRGQPRGNAFIGQNSGLAVIEDGEHGAMLTARGPGTRGFDDLRRGFLGAVIEDGGLALNNHQIVGGRTIRRDVQFAFLEVGFPNTSNVRRLSAKREGAEHG